MTTIIKEIRASRLSKFENRPPSDALLEEEELFIVVTDEELVVDVDVDVDDAVVTAVRTKLALSLIGPPTVTVTGLLVPV